jgi:hypothetical protein
MEQKIKSFINNSFNSISPQLHIANIALAVILIIIGINLLFKRPKTKKTKTKTIGFICLGIGVLSVLSQIIQIYFNYI